MARDAGGPCRPDRGRRVTRETASVPASGAAAGLRHRAEAAASALPPLLVQARHLAGSVLMGEHGRRRAGTGDDFWQYRPGQPGDSRRTIDWRRSARSDTQFVRQREWQVAQSVMLWVDRSASMDFTSLKDTTTKGDRARVLALAIAILLLQFDIRLMVLIQTTIVSFIQDLFPFLKTHH